MLNIMAMYSIVQLFVSCAVLILQRQAEVVKNKYASCLHFSIQRHIDLAVTFGCVCTEAFIIYILALSVFWWHPDCLA